VDSFHLLNFFEVRFAKLPPHIAGLRSHSVREGRVSGNGWETTTDCEISQPSPKNDRSQRRNCAQAMEMLKARLYDAELKKRETEAQADADAKSDIALATKSAPTSYNPNRWSRTCARPWKPATGAPCWTATSTCSWRRCWRPSWVGMTGRRPSRIRRRLVIG